MSIPTRIYKGAAFTEKNLFENFDTKSVEIPKDAVIAAKLDKRKKLCRRIFRDCYFLVLQDLIDRNVSFNLPVSPRNAQIKMMPVTGDDFKKAYSAGKFRSTDYLKSYFKAYEPIVQLNYKTWSKQIPINWCKHFYLQVSDKVNKGEQYG